MSPWHDRLPPGDHGVWRALQAALAVVGLAIIAVHGVDGGHAGGVDGSDVAGVGGLAIAGKLLFNAVKGN